jgi:hypothetical protein
MRIRILLLLNVMQICNHWFTDPAAALSASRHSMAHFETLRLLNLDINGEPDPAFTSMRTRNRLPKIMRIRIRLTLLLMMLYLPVVGELVHETVKEGGGSLVVHPELSPLREVVALLDILKNNSDISGTISIHQ